jgi:hypothetical protein
MTLTNLDNERGNLLNLINSLSTTISELPPPYSPPEAEAAIADALESEEVSSPTVTEYNALVGTVNDILIALRAYSIIEETP